VAAHQAGKISEAEFLYKLVLQTDKKQFDALHMLAVIEGQRGNFAAALSRIKEALRIRPKSADALINLGRIQGELGEDANAVATYQKALALNSQSPLAHSNLSILLRGEQRLEDALVHCDAAIAIARDYAEAWNNRGNVLFDLNRLSDALTSYDRALAIQPKLAESHVGRGNVLKLLARADEALDAYNRALAIKPDNAEAWLGRGNMLAEFKQYGDAVPAYDKALALTPDLAEAWVGRGTVFAVLKHYDEAYAAYDKAFRIQPELRELEGSRLHAKQCLCDWSFLEDDISYLLAAVRSGQPASSPFPLLAVPSSPADQLQCAKSYVANLPPFPPLWSGKSYAHDRIRVAYLSSDFREHALAYLTAGLFEEHDKSRFEVTAISYSPGQSESDVRRRIMGAFERFIDVGHQTDEQVAEIIRELEIDIAIDLNGITQFSRPNILSRRPAPVQVNYLGYASTMGADYIDYILADSTVIPADKFEFFSEKVIWLPDSFMVNDARRGIAERTPTRGDCALPENGFVFCCFNNSYKIAPEMFKIWMRLLKATANSVLWLSGHTPTIVANLRREAETSGISPDRIIFAPRIPSMDDHLARHRQADLFLDTLPYNAHATASDALWAGLPVLTCLGASFAGRVAASLDRAVGLPELVTNSLEEYEALALKFAQDPAQLAALKAKLASHRETYPLFDTKRFARNIEAAYTTIWQRHQRGDPPQSFAVETSPVHP